MSNEIKHYNHNHGKDGKFTFGSGGSISSFKSHNSNVKDINGRPVGEEKPVKGKKGLLYDADKMFFDHDRYQVSSVETWNDYAGYLTYSSNSPALKKKFPHLSQNKNTTGMVFTRHENVNDPTAVLHIKRDKNGQNKIDFLWTHGNKKDDVKHLYPYELFDIAHNVYGVKSGNKPGEIPLKPKLSEYSDPFTNKKKIHEDYTDSFNNKLINDNTNSKGEFEYGLSARKENNMNKKNYIQHGRGPSKMHKYIKIVNGRYIYPAVATIQQRVDNEQRVNQKNGRYSTSNKKIDKPSETLTIANLNKMHDKFEKRKRPNNAVGPITNAARMARRNTFRSNNYGYDRTTNYGRPKMNTASNAAERAFNSMPMPKLRKVKKSKLKEFMNNFKKKKKGQRIKTSDGDTRILSSKVRYR